MAIGFAVTASATAQEESRPARELDGPSFTDNVRVSRAESRIWVRVDPVRIGHAHGVEGTLSGQWAWSKGGTITFDLASMRADTPAARKEVGLTGAISDSDRQATTKNMLGADVLDVARFPTATFQIERFEPLDQQQNGQPGRYRVWGRFRLHGKERSLSFDASLVSKGEELRLRGRFTLRQTDYGMTPYSSLGGLAKIADELTIWGDLLIERR